VTGVTGGGVGYGILEAVKAAGYEAFATDVTPYSVGLFKAKRGYIVPHAGAASYLDAIRAVCKRSNIRIIVPGSEAELFVLSKHVKELEKEGIVVIANEHRLIAACRDKWDMFRMFKEKRIPCPDTALPDQYEEFKNSHGFPMLVKQRVGRGSRNIFVIRDDEDYAFYGKKLESEKVAFMLQEYVGEGAQEYTVGVVCRKDGSVLGSITVHRILEGFSLREEVTLGKQAVRTSTGISQGIIENNQMIQGQCEEYAVRLGATGPANFQGRLVDGVFVVFELNPRFSGTTPFRAGVGFNDVDLVIRDRLNHRASTPAFRTGVVALRSLEQTLVPLEEIEKLRAASVNTPRVTRQVGS
jgi:carbamoyl-phosphate synthase large subunit